MNSFSSWLNKQLDKIDFLELFVFTILTWFLRMVIPGVKFLFIPLLALCIIIFISQFKSVLIKHLYFTEFFKSILPFAILCLFFILPFSISGIFYKRSIVDFYELLVVVLLLFILFFCQHQSKDNNFLSRFFLKLSQYIGISSLIIALAGLIKYLFQNALIIPNGIMPFGTPFNSDRNFYALFAFLGIISFIPELIKIQNFKMRIILQLIILILSTNILFSYSLRAFIILIPILIAIFLVQILSIISQINDLYKVIAKNTRIVFYLFVAMLITSIITYHNYHGFHCLTGKVNGLISMFYSIEGGFNFEKWKFAWNLFYQQHWLKQLFGFGFKYLSQFGQHFFNDPARLDYPHNPILSAMLYSGIIGAIFALLFLIISVHYSIIYFKKYPLFSLMLWISLFFVFFSGNSLFSVPIFLFLFSFSFLIRHQEITDLHIDYNLLKPGRKLLKEVMDYILSTITFIVLLPVLVIISVLIFISMGWPVFYSQKRVGQNGKIFKLHKFRTMKNLPSISSVAAVEPERISGLGKILRKTKFDELPELWNIIRRDMSFVGPRPDVPGYADSLVGEERSILSLKPGLTGPASLKYINEDSLLAEQKNPQQYNDEIIFPDKVKINLAYIKYWSLWLDLKIIIFTALRKPLNEEYFK
jgi:lipopolysaccharide/colanic/teichoic acid biosynthesis glycosyltransferase